MKVLFLTGEFPPMQGGVGDYTREIGLALRTLGCSVQVVSATQSGPVPGLTVHPVIRRWNWGCWRSLLDLVRREQPDVVHIQYQAAAYAMHPAINFLPRRLRWSGLGRPRVVTTFHDLRVPYLFPKAGPLRRWVVEELARQSDVVITTNREDFETLERRLAAPPALIPIGSNIRPQLPAGYERDAWRARWGAGPADVLLSFFGFVNERKGVDTLLRALALLVGGKRKSLPGVPDPATSPHLVMIGGQTGASDPTNVAYLGAMQMLITELGLESRVHWAGYLPAEEVTASFLAADLCVLPFRDGVSFLHGTFHAALAHGVPIVTTLPRTPLPELVEGDNVLLIPAEEPQALAAAILRLVAAPELRRTLADGARVLAGQFRWERIAADTLELYRPPDILPQGRC